MVSATEEQIAVFFLLYNGYRELAYYNEEMSDIVLRGAIEKANKQSTSLLILSLVSVSITILTGTLIIPIVRIFFFYHLRCSEWRAKKKSCSSPTPSSTKST